MLKELQQTKRRIVKPVLICMMLLAVCFACACSNEDKEKMTFDALKKYGFINVGDREYEDFSEKKKNGAEQTISFSTFYIYDMGNVSYDVRFSYHSDEYSSYVITRYEGVEKHQYFTFEKDSNGELKNTDSYSRYIDVKLDNDKYGLKSIFMSDEDVYMDFDTEQIKTAGNPIGEYFESYEATGEVPNAELSLDGVAVKPTEVKMFDHTDTIEVRIGYDVDSFLSLDYIKVGDGIWQLPAVR